MSKRLIIDNVDFDTLNIQRLILVSILNRDTPPTEQEREELNGLVNMLDSWSDQQYRKIFNE